MKSRVVVIATSGSNLTILTKNYSSQSRQGLTDSTVMYDREEKIPLYAEANIMEVWLVDINAQIVEVYQVM